MQTLSPIAVSDCGLSSLQRSPGLLIDIHYQTAGLTRLSFGVYHRAGRIFLFGQNSDNQLSDVLGCIHFAAL